MFRSNFERQVAKKLTRYKYEPFTLDYVVHKKYLPDFVNETKKILVEVKGYFRTTSEASKYISVREAHPEYEIVFVFSDGNKPMPGSRKRKDGTRFTHGEWATTNGFRWATLETIKDLKL